MSTDSLAAVSPDHWQQALNDKQKRALSMLGQGVAPVLVASTLGVTESLISQYLAEPRFAEEVTRRKLAALQKQTGVDDKYLEAEDKLVDKLLKTIPLITKPMDILRGIQIVNATKRRGVSDAPVGTHISQVVNITLPGAFAAKLVTNAQNQVVEVLDESGPRSLITASSGSLDSLAEQAFRSAKEIAGTGGEETVSPTIDSDTLARLSELQPAPVATEDKRLRRSLEAKGQITSDDL